MKEIDLQAKLVTTVKRQLNGQAFKASNRFLKGILDLCVQTPDLGTVFVEVKYESRANSKGFVPLELTQLQRVFIRDWRRAGGKAGWLIFLPAARGQYRIMTGVDHDAKQVSLDDFSTRGFTADFSIGVEIGRAFRRIAEGD